ncbi:MAG: hypothetical protein AAGC64_12260 [Bacteroidota bacterium]
MSTYTDSWTTHRKSGDLFVDGIHSQHNTPSASTWSKKGEKRYISSNCGRNRIKLDEAYAPHSQEVIIREDASIGRIIYP